MAKNKTLETENSVKEYLDNIPDPKRSQDCSEIIEVFKDQTGLEPKMWGTGIVGFGSYHYKYESGHEGDAPLTGLASRSNAITLYLASDYEGKQELLQKLGKHTTRGGCIYIKRLKDINTSVLKEMISISVKYMREKYPS